MMIRCPDGRLINMDLVYSVAAEIDDYDNSWWVKFSIDSRSHEAVYLCCENEAQARKFVDLIFRARVSRLDLSKE